MCQLFCTRELLEREHLVHRVRVGGPEVGPVLLGGDLELATFAPVVRLLLVAAAAARLRCDPVFRLTDVEEGVPGRLGVVVVPFEHEDLVPALVREIQVLNLLLLLGEGLAFLLLLAQLAHLLQERLLRELLLLKVVLVSLFPFAAAKAAAMNSVRCFMRTIAIARAPLRL